MNGMLSNIRTNMAGLLRSQALFRNQGYIGGKWIKSEREFPVFNPATGEQIGQVADMRTTDAEQAVQKAHGALKPWKLTTCKERSEKLRTWFNLITKHETELAEMITAEQGKPLSEAKLEVRYGASFVEWYAEEAKRVYGDVMPSPTPSKRLLVLKQPVGVALLITPWNFPVAMLTRKASPALAAGCTVIIKPSEETPYSALALQKLAEDAGFSPGVINTVTCSRDHVTSVTDVMIKSDVVTALSFTGSTATGKILMSKCADTVKKMSLELGGNAPFIVFNSADVDAAVAGAVASKFRNTAQTCVCTNRLLVQDEIYEEFSARFAVAVDRLKVGNGMDESTTQGPLINEKAVDKVDRHVQDALSRGAKLVRGGVRHELGRAFYWPTILTDVTNDMLVCQEETFGPVAPIIRFQTEEEAVELANATNYGLAGYFFSRDLSQIWRVAEALDVGVLGINEGLVSTEFAPFSGWKQSGLGRESSKYGIEEYLETKYICLGGISSLS